MVGKMIFFLKETLNASFREKEGSSFEGEVVDFIDHGKDPPVFHFPISVMVVNFEEETQLRSADRYSLAAHGQKYPAFPALRLMAHLLFAAKPSSPANYENALEQLANVMKFFQANPVFSPGQYPLMYDKGLGDQKLTVEMLPLTYAQQNEIWSALKSAYLPCVCYRVKMIVYQEEPASMAGEIEKTEFNFRSP